MVSLNSGHPVSRQLLVRQERCMSVYNQMIEKCKFRKHPRITVNDGIIVHYLAKAEDSGMSYKPVHVICSKHASIVVYIRCRNTRRQHYEYIGRRFFCLSENIFDAVCTGNIAGLMRVYNEGSCSVSCSCCNEFCRRNHCGFKVQMRVDESGSNICSVQIYLRLALI